MPDCAWVANLKYCQGRLARDLVPSHSRSSSITHPQDQQRANPPTSSSPHPVPLHIEKDLHPSYPSPKTTLSIEGLSSALQVSQSKTFLRNHSHFSSLLPAGMSKLGGGGSTGFVFSISTDL